MKTLYPNGLTSVILRVKIRDATSALDAGLTGLTFNSVGLIISTIADNEATPTVYTQAAGNIEAVGTLGTYAAPTASKCRFKLVDNTNHPGLYEMQLADARFAVAAARSLVVTVTGPSALNICQEDWEIQLQALSGLRKNQALAKVEFLMTDSTNHNPVTGKTVTVTRSIDNGAFAAGTLSAVTEISNGIYSVDFGAGDLNGGVITLRATAAGSDDTFVTVIPDP